MQSLIFCLCLKRRASFSYASARNTWLVDGPFGPSCDSLGYMQKKMLNRRKYTQSQKTGHENGFFQPLDGLDDNAFAGNLIFRVKMICFIMFHIKTCHTFSTNHSTKFV